MEKTQEPKEVSPQEKSSSESGWFSSVYHYKPFNRKEEKALKRANKAIIKSQAKKSRAYFDGIGEIND